MPERTSAYRKLLIGAASAIVVLVVVVLVAPLLIPSDVIAAQIAALVRQKTGRDLRIAGPISFSLLPRPTLVARDVTMSNPPGDFTANFLEVQTVDMSLRSRALLHGAIEIDQLHLSHPILNLEIDKDGQRNWIFHLPKAEPSTAPAAPRRAPPSFATGNAQLADGEVNYSHDHAGEKQSVSNVTMTLSLPGLDRPLTANGTATYRGEPVRLSLSLASPGEFRDGRASAATMALSSARGSFDFHGSINRGANPRVNGTISANVPSLRELLSWTNIKIGPDDKGLGAFALSGHIEHTGPQTLLSNATVSLDDVPAKGTFRLTHAEKRDELTFDNVETGGGTAGGDIVADRSGASPSLTADVKLARVTVHQLSFNIAGFDTLSGTGDATFGLTATGKTMRELIASLNGTARIDFADGSVGSGGLSPFMKNALGPAVSEKTIPREIAYRTLSASATIENGVLHNSDLKLAGPQLNATGGGTLELAPRRIDYLWQPDITGLGSARIAITGAWDNPEYKVESVTVTKGISIPGLKLR